MTPSLSKTVVDFVLAQARSDVYGAYCRNRLLELLDIDTSVADTASLPANEAVMLALIEKEMRRSLGNAACIERRPAAGYAPAADDAPAPRQDLLVRPRAAAPAEGDGIFYTVGLDTLGPFAAPRSTGDRVFGCGAAGNKTHIAMLLAQARLLADVQAQFGQGPRLPVAYHFGAAAPGGSIEDTAAAGRLVPAGWNAVVLASTGGAPLVSQIGCVRFRLVLGASHATELFPFIVAALEAEGNRLRAEAVAEPADLRRTLSQTNCGTFGPYGTHPALACEHVAVRVRIIARGNPERIAMRMTEILDAAMAEYLRHRPDLTRAVDAATGEPKLRRHYALQFEPVPDAVQYRIDVFGRRACPAAAGEADNAISKAAVLFGALLRIRRNFPNARTEAALADAPASPAEVAIAGTQTFVAPLDAASVRKQLAAAVHASLADYRRVTGRTAADHAVRIAFEEPDREPLVQAAPPAVLTAFQSAGAAASIPLTTGGTWPSISHADRFAEASHPAVIFGPGRLDRTDTANECIEVPEIQQTLALSTLATLTYGPA